MKVLQIMVKRVLRPVLLAIVALPLAGFGLHLHYKSRIFQPDDELPDPGASPFAVETVTIETVDGLVLNSWWRPPETGKAVVLYLHGNAQHVGNYVRGAAPLAEAGFGVLMLDYRGYGGNPGEPSDEGLIKDGHAALAWLEAHGYPSEDIFLYGYSLGTGVAVPLAAEREVAGVVLAAPFASIAEMGYATYPQWFVDLLLADRFDSILHINAVEEPVLILHGDRDRTVPPRQSELLAAAGGNNIRRLVIDGAGHGWELFEPRGNAAILAFLNGPEPVARSRDPRP